MRVAVLILALLGTVSAAFLGVNWGLEYYTNGERYRREKREFEAARALIEQFGGAQNALVSDDVKMNEELIKEGDRRARAFPCLLSASLLGLAGGLLVYAKGRGVIGGPMMIIPVAAGAYFHPVAVASFGSPLLLAGALSFLVWPRPKKDRAE